MRNWKRAVMLLGAVCLMLARPALAEGDRVSVASDINVEEGSTAGDLVCLLCTVRVHGDVHGDVVTLLGSVAVDDEHSISGDVVAVGGSVSLGDGANVNGDVAVVAGHLSKGTGASIRGDSNVEEGKGWMVLPFAPILILAGLVWLIAWLVTRRRYPLQTYPQDRRF